MSRPPFPPYPAYPPYAPHASPAPYPPYPPYPAAQFVGGEGIAQTGSFRAPDSPAVPGPPSPNSPTPTPPATGETQQPPGTKPAPPGALSIFFDYGRYQWVDSTVEGIGQNQNAKVAKFVADSTAAQVTQIVVTGFASPEDNLTTTLPMNRANRLKQKLDELFAQGAVRPTVTVGPTGVLNGNQSTWPSLRRADASVVA